LNKLFSSKQADGEGGLLQTSDLRSFASWYRAPRSRLLGTAGWRDLSQNAAEELACSLPGSFQWD